MAAAACCCFESADELSIGVTNFQSMAARMVLAASSYVLVLAVYPAEKVQVIHLQENRFSLGLVVSTSEINTNPNLDMFFSSVVRVTGATNTHLPPLLLCLLCLRQMSPIYQRDLLRAFAMGVVVAPQRDVSIEGKQKPELSIAGGRLQQLPMGRLHHRRQDTP